MAHSALEEQFIALLEANGIDGWVREFRFHPSRRWRFDFAWPDKLIAVEIEGGTWTGGRHTRGKGFDADCDKYNAAVLSGWRVLRFTSTHLKSDQILPILSNLKIARAELTTNQYNPLID